MKGVTGTTSSSYFPFASASHFELLASTPRPCLIARSAPGAKPSWVPMLAQALASRCSVSSAGIACPSSSSRSSP